MPTPKHYLSPVWTECHVDYRHTQKRQIKWTRCHHVVARDSTAGRLQSDIQIHNAMFQIRGPSSLVSTVLHTNSATRWLLSADHRAFRDQKNSDDTALFASDVLLGWKSRDNAACSGFHCARGCCCLYTQCCSPLPAKQPARLQVGQCDETVNLSGSATGNFVSAPLTVRSSQSEHHTTHGRRNGITRHSRRLEMRSCYSKSILILLGP